MFTKIVQLIMLYFSTSVLFYTVLYWYLYIYILIYNQWSPNDQKNLLAALAIFPGGMAGGLGFHAARPVQNSSAQGRNLAP